MPELPDILLYLSALKPRIVGQPLQHVRLMSPFLLRTVDPRIDEAQGKTVTGLRRLGKRIVWELQDDLFLVFHLMIVRFDDRRHPVEPDESCHSTSTAFEDAASRRRTLRSLAARKLGLWRRVEGYDAYGTLVRYLFPRTV